MIGDTGGKGTTERIRSKTIQRKTTRSTGGKGLGFEFRSRGRVEGEDGESGILAANFFNEMETQIIPGVEVEEDGVPAAVGERAEEIGDRVETMNVEASRSGSRQGLRDR